MIRPFNRRPDDEIVELVFGEMDEVRAAEVEKRVAADPRVRSLAEGYRQLRDDLGTLREVPEDQLSSERLRHAILAKGLAHEKRSNGLSSWIWMPGLAACFAFGLLVLRNQGTFADAPKVVLSQRTAGGAEEVKLSPSVSPKVEKVIAANVGTSEVSPTAPRPKAGSRNRHGERTALAQKEPAPDSEGVLAMRITEGQPYLAAENLVDDLRTAVVSVDPIAASPAEEATTDFVVIDGERNEQTGTNTATEVASYSNVLVGG